MAPTERVEIRRYLAVSAFAMFAIWYIFLSYKSISSLHISTQFKSVILDSQQYNNKYSNVTCLMPADARYFSYTNTIFRSKQHLVSKHKSFYKLHHKNGNLIILFWNNVGWIKRHYVEQDMDKCPVSIKCKLSFKRDLFNRSKAVVYSLANYGLGQKPPVQFDKRNPNQPWIFFTMEAPGHLKPEFRSGEWRHVFNWSWTYRADSDIFFPYGNFKQNQLLSNRNYSAIYNSKRQFAVWAVSHCNTLSRRERYVDILRKHIDVDIVGKCTEGQKLSKQELRRLINKDYKFYLSFENALCKDYVTEKLFYYYNLDVVLVLRGNLRYQKYLPKYSYIDTSDFSSISSLAHFLEEVASDEMKYVNYLKRKDFFIAQQINVTFRDSFCNVCHKLNNLERYRRQYDNVEDWIGNCEKVTDLKEI